MLIAVKEGITLFRGGTIFEVEDTISVKKADGTVHECLQLPDDGMGRPLLIETKDVFVCDDNELRNAEPGHGRCYFSKEEIVHPSQQVYQHDFSPRSISFERAGEAWRLSWRIPSSNNLDKKCEFFNKVTKETTVVAASHDEIEYSEISISAVDYRQTVRKRTAPHHVWDLQPLKPGFYVGEIDLGNGFKGRIHFIKHFNQQLSNKDPRETNDIAEVSFSAELWNTALKQKLAWGPKSRIPFQVRLLESFPYLKWAQANYLDKICNETLSFAWNAYEREVDGEIADAKDELAKSFPWIDDDRHAQLKVLGEYYARMKR